MKKLVYVDANQDNLGLIKYALGNHFFIESFSEPDEFFKHLSSLDLSAILLDIDHPVSDGISVMSKIQESNQYNGCPLFSLTSVNSEQNRLKAFSQGAADFLLRDFTPQELLLRVHSKIQFFEKHKTIVELDGLELNLTRLNAVFKKQEFKLTFTEFKVLYLLLKNHPEFVSKEVMIDLLWKETQVSDATLYTHVFNLNAKLKNWCHEVTIERQSGMRLIPKKTLI
jgi:two-component system response regulator VanR